MQQRFSAKHLSLIGLIFLFNCSAPQVPRIIFDTDFGGDADDLGALAMLNNFVNKQECELMGVMCWNVEPFAVSAISAVNTFYGNPDIPIGTRKDTGEYIDWMHGKVLTENFPHQVNAESAPETTVLYRKLLAESADNEVVIVTVGPLSNIMRLINSEPDDLSPLNGLQLIERKVKEFVIMGGEYPSGEQEWNFDGNMPGVTKYVLENLTVPITFSGYELGVNLKTGEVFNEIDKESPLYKGFMHFSKYCPWLNDQFEGKIYDNATYDQTAVLYAVRNGVGDYWSRVEDGYCVADSTGGNEWKTATDTNHAYLKLIREQEDMATVIENFMINNF